jgi:hypothetical protein
MSILANIIPGWKIISGVVGTVVVGLLAWWVIDTWVIGPRDLNQVQRTALEVATQDLIGQLNRHLDAADRFNMSLALLQVRNDTSNGEAHDLLMRQMKASPRIDVPGEGVLNDVRGAAKDWLLGSSTQVPEKLLADRGELDAVMLVIFERRNTSTIAASTLKAELVERVYVEGKATEAISREKLEASGEVDIQTGKPVGAMVVSPELTSGPTGGFYEIVGRFMIALLLGLGLPFLFLPGTEMVIKKKNNTVTGIWIGVITAVAMVPYVLIVMMASGGFLAWLVGFAVAAAVWKWTHDMHDAWIANRG